MEKLSTLPLLVSLYANCMHMVMDLAERDSAMTHTQKNPHSLLFIKYYNTAEQSKEQGDSMHSGRSTIHSGRKVQSLGLCTKSLFTQNL